MSDKPLHVHMHNKDYLFTDRYLCTYISEKKKKKGRTLVPWVLVTRVFPIFLILKTEGALMSYQSFFANGSTLFSHKPPIRKKLKQSI